MQANIAANQRAAVLGDFPKKTLADVTTKEELASYYYYQVSPIQPSALIVTQSRDDDIQLAEDCETRAVELTGNPECSEDNYDWQNVMDQIRADPSLAKDDREGVLPLHAACGAGAPIHVIKMLLKIYPEAARTKSDSGHLPLMCHMILNSESPSEGVVSALLEAYPEAAAVVDENNQLPIHLACMATGASKNIFTLLLRAHPAGAYVCDIEGLYPVDYAARNNDAATRKAALTSLIANDPEEFRGHYVEKDETTEVKMNEIDIELLLNGPASETKENLVNLTDDIIQDILTSFTSSQETQEVQHLRRATSEELASVSNVIDEKSLLLHLDQCLEQGSKPSQVIVTTLIEHYPTSARVTNANDQLPIHLACKAVDVELDIFTLLLRAFPQGAYACDVNGKCPIDYAVCNKDVSTRKYAIDALVLSDAQIRTYTSSSPPTSTDVPPEISQKSESTAVYSPTAPTKKENDPAVEKTLLQHLEHCIAHGGPPSQAIIAEIIESYPSSARVANAKNQLPIHLACGAVNVSETILTLLLITYPEGAYVCDADGLYPIDHAAQNKDATTKKTAIAALMQNDAVIKFMRASSARHFTEASSVLSEEDGQEVGLFKSGNEDSIEEDEANANALYEVLTRYASPPEATVSSIVESSPGAARVLDADGKLPLHHACRAKRVSVNMFAYILGAYPEGAYVPDKAGKYPIDYASENNDTETKMNAIAALLHNDAAKELASKRVEDPGCAGDCGLW